MVIFYSYVSLPEGKQIQQNLFDVSLKTLWQSNTEMDTLWLVDDFHSSSHRTWG